MNKSNLTFPIFPGADGDGASLETIISERDIDQSFEHVLEQLDPKVMHLGGSALHWAKSQQCLEALLDMGLNINGRNFQGETVRCPSKTIKFDID